MMKAIGENKIAPDLFPAQLEAVHAAGGVIVSSMNEKSVYEALNGFISLAYVTVGQSPDKDRDKLTAQELAHDIKTKWKYLTIEEVGLAIKMGCKGEFGEVKHVPIVTILNITSWINSYIRMVRNEAFAKQRKYEMQLVEQDQQKRKEQGDILLKQSIIECYNQFCQGKTILEALSYSPDPVHLASIHFVHLGRSGLIDIDKEEWKMIYDIASHQIEARRPNKKEDRKGWELFQNSESSQKLSLARFMALEDVFRKWKENSFTLKF